MQCRAAISVYRSFIVRRLEREKLSSQMTALSLEPLSLLVSIMLKKDGVIVINYQ